VATIDLPLLVIGAPVPREGVENERELIRFLRELALWAARVRDESFLWLLTLGPTLSGSYRETTGGAFPSAVTWWDSPAKAKKLASLTIARNPNMTPSVEVLAAYDTDGVTPVITLTDTIAYIGVFEASRVRTVA
jgi:hypothetical protein